MKLRWIVDWPTAGSGPNSRMLWTAPKIRLRRPTTTISVTAEDIKGLTTVRTLRVRH
jgi:hypothetical protein